MPHLRYRFAAAITQLSFERLTFAKPASVFSSSPTAKKLSQQQSPCRLASPIYPCEHLLQLHLRKSDDRFGSTSYVTTSQRRCCLLESKVGQFVRFVDMGKRSGVSILLLSFWVSIVVVAGQSPWGTEHVTLPGTSSNDSCANADCQQGTCVPNDNVLLSILFPYKCQCNPGWATLEKIVPILKVPSLPCNVPNCTLNVNCSGDSPAAAPSPSSPLASGSASLCLVPGICGHGTCEVVSSGVITSAIKCVCDPGYSNVFNTTGGYCLNDCEIRGGCSSLNLTLPGSSSPSPPGTASNQTATNTGCSSISFSRTLYITTTLAIVWSFLTR